MTAGAEFAGWVPVALSDGLSDGGVMRVQTGGRDLALWRAHDHSVHCVDNRCPHRGMRLSFGFVRGNRLNCIYHGWQYGVTGACAYIPAHPELTPPESLCVPTLPCVDQGGRVWITLDPDPTALPAMPVHPGLRSVAVNVSPDRVRAALSAGALPATTHPQRGCRARVLETSARDSRIALDVATGDTATLVLSIQSVAADRSQLHTQLTDDASVALKVAASRWLDALRDHLEVTP